jgi:hypothetical protein
VTQRAHELLTCCLIQLAVLEEAYEAAAGSWALRQRVVEQGQVCELYLTAVLATEEVIVAEEQVYACPEVLGHIYSTTEQEVLDTLPLVWRVASLDTITATVPVRITIKLAALPATLLEEATDSCTARVLCIATAVRDLQPPELNYSCNIGIDRAPRQERALRRLLSCRCQGRRWHIALTVVCEQLSCLSQGHIQRLCQRLDLCQGRGVCLLLLLLELTLVLLLP